MDVLLLVAEISFMRLQQTDHNFLEMTHAVSQQKLRRKDRCETQREQDYLQDSVTRVKKVIHVPLLYA